MSRPERIFEWAGPGYDVAFLDNAFISHYRWSEAGAGVDETSRSVLAAVRALARLWAPSLCPVALGRFEDGLPEPGGTFLEVTAKKPEEFVSALEAAVAEALDARPAGAWGIQSVGPAQQGWSRIALPAGVDAPGEWRLASDEGWVSLRYSVEPAEELAGQRTIWLRLEDIAAASDLSAFVDAAGSAEARLTVGATFFSPEADPRPPDVDVRGAPLRAWQEANAALLSAVEAELAGASWIPSRV